MVSRIGAAWLAQPALQTMFGVLDGAKRRTRAVGGVVRDSLMAQARPASDIDLATELLPQDVMARAEAAGIACHPTGLAHGTVTLVLDGLVAEVTTLRQDMETDGRHAVVRFGTDWHQDAARRDFTINALYCDQDGTIFDPLGGLADIAARRVRFIGDPDQRIAEDRLRVFRFFRFTASHGGERFDAAGLEACYRASGRLGNLSAERVGTEMTRLLALPACAATLAAMANCEVLALSPQSLATLHRYEASTPHPALAGRLALVMLDGLEAKALQERWRLSNALIEAAENLLRAVLLLEAGKLAEARYRLPDTVSEALVLVAARGMADVDALRTGLQEIGFGPLPIAGRDLLEMGYPPGRALGQELARLEALFIESNLTLSRAQLLGRARRPPQGSV